jgi:uncharacterized protein (DUF2336 family)
MLLILLIRSGDASKTVWATLRVIEGDAFVFVLTHNEKAKSHELLVFSTTRNEETKKTEAKFVASHSYAEQVRIETIIYFLIFLIHSFRLK